MLFRSTGLGKAEIAADVVEIKRQGDYLIMEMKTSDPVKWKIRGGMSHKDLRVLLKAMLKRPVMSFLFNPACWFRQPEHPGKF